jgi:hypothetical protein
MLRWLVFLPLILSPVPAYKGLAVADTSHMEDIDTLGAAWFYNWGVSADNVPITADFVPMLWRGNPSPYIQSDYEGWLLVFNEPNQPVELVTRRGREALQRPTRLLPPRAPDMLRRVDLGRCVAAGVLPPGW